MIYQLNNETHWEIAPEVMRAVITLIDRRDPVGAGESPGLTIGMCNLRSAFECELMRLADKRPITPPVADNSDLLG